MFKSLFTVGIIVASAAGALAQQPASVRVAGTVEDFDGRVLAIKSEKLGEVKVHLTADATVFVDGGLRTGDVGTIDAEGYVRIVDRLKDMISVGGFKVFPSQVEAVLYGHPAVREAIVIGVPDAYHGERPKAFVTLAEGQAADGEELAAWLNADHALYQAKETGRNRVCLQAVSPG